MKLDTITFFINIFFLPIWLLWELAILKLRGQGVDAGTISMVMKNHAYGWNFIPFFWSSMMAHWWLNWVGRPVWSSPIPAITYWVLVAATLGLDVYLWRAGIDYPLLSPLAKFFRAPAVQCGLGLLLGYVLFPQRMNLSPGWRWW